jgi:integrase
MKLPDNFDIIEIERGNFLEVDEDVIYLTENELERIISLDLKQDYLINARKWLLLGSYTGQRIDDQFNKFIQDNFIETKSGIEIHLTQSKTGAKVKIPVHPHIKDILNPENMPRVISRQKLNDYMKKICELAEINELINDQKRGFVKEVTLLGKKRKIYRKIKKERPKYDYIASHTGRRTFCMMWYKNKKLSNNEIMAVTGHETEKSFLTYINKSNDDHIKAFTDEYDKINL